MKNILITGARGEIGRALQEELLQRENVTIISLDRKEQPKSDNPRVIPFHCDITNDQALSELFSQYDINCIFHLAAVLSSAGEKDPFMAHNVNVQGSTLLMKFAMEQAQANSHSVRFIFPSSIAVYGIPSGSTRENVQEDQYLHPTTMYGINKLYVEQIGHYFDKKADRFEFGCLRFPGLISAFSLPTGGTSDFASHMIHAAARGEPHSCYVSADKDMPFMVMPDAVHALLSLYKASSNAIQGKSYNVTSFSLGPQITLNALHQTFSNFEINYNIEKWREDIILRWPATLDDSLARKDWGWEPQYDFTRAFEEYLIPNIRSRYE